MPEHELPETTLDDLITAWLGRSTARLDLRFPSGLERIYVTETLGARIRAMRVSSIAGCLAALVLAPAAWRLLPDARPLVRLAWIQFGLPVSLLSQCLVWIRLPIAWQEVQVAATCLLASGAIAIMLLGSINGQASELSACMVMMLLMALVGTRLSFRMAAVFAPAMVALFGFTASHLPHQNGMSAALLTVLMAITSFYALFGNWRLEAETRRSYALMLRARLGQQELSRRNSELDELTRRDPLTGLANRRAYDNWLNAAWNRAQASGAPLGLIVVDVDSFKLYNDFYGHPAGDVCLQTVATCLREQLRDTTDLLARIGGEEFAMILPGLSLPVCGDVAERLRRAVAALETPHFGIGMTSMVSISLGAASVVPSTTLTARTLAAAADRALYAAKQAGRNCVYLAGIDAVEGDVVKLPLRKLGVQE